MVSHPLREKTLVTPLDEISLGEYPFKDDLPLVYLGEIANMPGHGLFAGTRTGKMYCGYHLAIFRELTGEEI